MSSVPTILTTWKKGGGARPCGRRVISKAYSAITSATSGPDHYKLATSSYAACSRAWG